MHRLNEADGGAGVMTQGHDFRGRQFTAEVILWAVRWYLMFPISYRDLELMLQDRGVAVDHTTLTWAFRSQVHDYGIMGASFGGCWGSKV
jgi:transposase-like protein